MNRGRSNTLVILREPKRPKDLRCDQTRSLAAIRMTSAIAVFTFGLTSLALAAAETAAPLQSEASDGPVKVTARINTSTVRVAEPIQFVLEVEAPRGTRIELPAKTDRLGEFEVR